MPSLLDNRRKQTPRQSMEILVAYARKQDKAIMDRRLRIGRAGIFVNLIFFGTISTYVGWNFLHGYWQSIYPRSLLSTIFEGAPSSNKRLFFTPELYLKDRDRLNEDLRIKQNSAAKQPQ